MYYFDAESFMRGEISRTTIRFQIKFRSKLNRQAS